MPTLLLPPRITEDSVKLWRTCTVAHWDTLRLSHWRAPETLDPAHIAVYGGYFIALAQDRRHLNIRPPLPKDPCSGQSRLWGGRPAGRGVRRPFLGKQAHPG